MNNPVCKDCATNEAYQQLEAENKKLKEKKVVKIKHIDSAGKNTMYVEFECPNCAKLETENKELKQENELYRKFTDKVRRIIKHEKENGCLECETRNDGNCGKCPIGKIEKLVWLDKE